MSSPDADNLLGHELDGFRIDAVLGRGATATVYQATQVSLDRQVALKVLDRQWSQHPEFVLHFISEAQIAGAISSPFVVGIHAAGIIDGQLYMALEMATNGDVRLHYKDTGGRLPPGRVARILLDAACGLDALHRAGLVHRDMKPANFFIADDGRIMLGDLGLARDVGLNGDKRVVGTPSYMAPEQALGRDDCDIRADIYGLGASGWRLLRGADPIPGKGDMDHLRRVAIQDGNPAIGAPQSLEHGVIGIINRCMQPNPADRYQTPAGLMADLEVVIGSGAVVPLKSSDAAAVPTTTRTSARRSGRRPARRLSRLVQIGIFAGLALVTALVATGMLGGQ